MHCDAYEAAMQTENDAILDDILSRWHCWAQHMPSEVGWHQVAQGFDQFRASRQYDDQNGALDALQWASVMEAVDFQVGEMRDPHRTAVHVMARNLYCGVSVWRSPRLPADVGARAKLMAEAREMVRERLIGAGVL